MDKKFESEEYKNAVLSFDSWRKNWRQRFLWLTAALLVLIFVAPIPPLILIIGGMFFGLTNFFSRWLFINKWQLTGHITQGLGSVVMIVLIISQVSNNEAINSSTWFFTLSHGIAWVMIPALLINGVLMVYFGVSSGDSSCNNT